MTCLCSCDVYWMVLDETFPPMMDSGWIKSSFSGIKGFHPFFLSVFTFSSIFGRLDKLTTMDG